MFRSMPVSLFRTAWIPALLLGLFILLPPVHAKLVAAESVPAQFFGMHIHRAAHTFPTAWPVIPFGAWRLWDASVSWVNLEPEQGKWDFSKLDRLVALGEKNGVELLLTLGLTPRWAAARPGDYSAYGPGYSSEPMNLEDWRTYVRTVAVRYQGRVRAYEVWNEPNLKGFYSGTPAIMVELAREAYTILKEVDSSNIIVSPSSGGGGPKGNGVTWLEEYLKAGGGRYADVIGYHFYVLPEPPEKMLSLIAEVRRILAAHGAAEKPLWNTELGWDIVGKDNPQSRDALTEEMAGAYIARAHLLNRASGIERLYWYAWDNYKMGLASSDGRTLKNTLITAYTNTVQWLIGTDVQGCAPEADGNWMCRLLRKGGGEARIIWRPDGIEWWALPTNWKGATATDLLGRQWAVKGGGIGVGPSPVLVESTP